MFNLIFVLFFGIIGAVLFQFGTYETNTFIPDAYFVLSIASFIISFIWFISSIISSMAYYSSQCYRIEDLKSDLKILENHKKTQENLLKDFKSYLSEKYPEIENKIFNNINNNTQMILKYPEIKSSKTLSKLVDKINELSQDILKIKDRIENDKADIRYYQGSKWEYFKVKLTPDMKEIIYS